MRKVKKITIKDVAIQAGVSPTTVSRVLNNKVNGYMREETSKRVRQAIEQIEYVPDVRARSLRGLQSGVVGLIIPEGMAPFYQQLAYTLADVCYKEEYGLLLCSSQNNPGRELAYIRLLQSQKVDGIVISTEYLSRDKVNSLISGGIPIVLVDEDVPGANASAVFTDNYQGACVATQYLIDLSHTKISFISGRLKALSCRERLRGYRYTLEKNGLEVNNRIIVKGDLSYKSGYNAMVRLLRDKERKFTAVFCSNDFMALGAMRAIQDRDGHVPNDYSIIGFDDVYMASMSNPRLTTVAQPINQIAKKALRAIKYQWKNVSGRKPIHQYLRAKLVIRESCKDISK